MPLRRKKCCSGWVRTHLCIPPPALSFNSRVPPLRGKSSNTTRFGQTPSLVAAKGGPVSPDTDLGSPSQVSAPRYGSTRDRTSPPLLPSSHTLAPTPDPDMDVPFSPDKTAAPHPRTGVAINGGTPPLPDPPVISSSDLVGVQPSLFEFQFVTMDNGECNQF